MRRNVFLKQITLCVASMLFAFPMAGLGHAASLQAGVMSLTIPEAADLTPTEAGLIKVQLSGSNADTDPNGTYVGAHGLRLPGTFKGTLPCADCDGIAHHLDLWPDGTYHMRRIWLGGEGNNQSDEIGRWFADPARQAIVLNGASERPLQWQILGEDRLRQLAMDGTPIESTLNYELTNETGLDATDVEDVFLAGMARVSPERATFEDCLTGRLYDISVDGAWGDLASAYEADVDAADVPLFAQVEATLRMQGADAAGDGAEMVLGRLIETDPDRQCDPRCLTLPLSQWIATRRDGSPPAGCSA